MRCRQRICHDRCSRFPVESVTLRCFETCAPRVSQRRGYNNLASQQ